jgi:hypothetical protein
MINPVQPIPSTTSRSFPQRRRIYSMSAQIRLERNDYNEILEQT